MTPLRARLLLPLLELEDCFGAPLAVSAGVANVLPGVAEEEEEDTLFFLSRGVLVLGLVLDTPLPLPLPLTLALPLPLPLPLPTLSLFLSLSLPVSLSLSLSFCFLRGRPDGGFPDEGATTWGGVGTKSSTPLHCEES